MVHRILYLDDLEDESHNSYCGELRAIHEFNIENDLRKIERHKFFKSYRLLKNTRWIDHIFTLHVLDHPLRFEVKKRKKNPIVLENPYIN